MCRYAEATDSLYFLGSYDVYRSRPAFPPVALLFVICLAAHLRAQTSEQPGSAPADRTLPGFSVLDSSLMSIEHINPLHATSITLFSTLRNDDLLPRDIAFEHLPLLAPPTGRAPTVSDQYARLAEPGIAETLLRYFAVSLAISQGVTRVGRTSPCRRCRSGSGRSCPPAASGPFRQPRRTVPESERGARRIRARSRKASGRPATGRGSR